MATLPLLTTEQSMLQTEHITNRADYIIDKKAGFTKSFAESSAKCFAAGLIGKPRQLHSRTTPLIDGPETPRPNRVA